MPTDRLTFIAAFAGLCLFAFLVAAVGQSVPRTPAERPVASTDPALAAHCSQHVELARANFGADWKRRLDPRDTLCAEQVQQAWERDWQPRETPPELVVQPKAVASAAAPPSMVAPPQEEPAQRANTYALAAVTDANKNFAKPAGQDTTTTKPASRDASTVKPARQDTSKAKTARQDTRTTESAGQNLNVADVADQDASVADPASHEDATDSNDASAYDHASYAAFEDGDQGGRGDQGDMVADERGQDGHSFSFSDDADVETRTLNNEQLDRRPRYEDDIQHPPYADGEADEYDDVGDIEAP